VEEATKEGYGYWDLGLENVGAWKHLFMGLVYL